MHTPAMTTRILLIVALGFSTLHAADPTSEDLLRQGLFEEEANHDLDKAAGHYRAVITAHDRQRTLAASATFRLGEIARKKNDKDAAAAAFRTVAERFPEQAELARLSRENLAALGVNLPSAEKTDAPPAVVANDPEDAEIARLKDIARNSPDLIDGPNSDGWRPMHLAAKNGWTKVIAYLLENKADPNGRTTKEQLTPLQITTYQGHLGAMKDLLAAKAEIDATFEIGRCPDGVLPARERKADKAQGKWSALDLAVLFDRREIARALIKAGADIKRRGPIREHYKSGYTTLELAIYLKRNDLANDLIDAGAAVKSGSDLEIASPLLLAVTENLDMLSPLLKAGADPKEPSTRDLVTPLHFASTAEIAKLLLDAGADANAVNAEGQTPLHVTYYPELVELLVSRGANPNAKDKRGLKPLDSVVARGGQDSSVFEALLKHGALVEDAKALLKHTSPQMLPVVREKVAYPKEYKEDAILISSGNSLEITEIRPAIGSPPPTVFEVLWLAFGGANNMRQISLKIVRRNTDGKFFTWFELAPDGGEPSLESVPSLEWGDIVEVETSNNANYPSIGNVANNLILPRSVTIRLENISFTRQLKATSEFWLEPTDPEVRSRPRVVPPPQPGMPQPVQPQPMRRQTRSNESSKVPEYFDFSRISVTRKGVEKPIVVDLTQKDSREFRLIDGDVLDFILLDSARKEMEQKEQALYIKGDYSLSARPLKVGGLLGALHDAGMILYQNNFPNEPDWSDLRIVRAGKDRKVERFDLVEWTSKLPPREKWVESTFESAPKLDAGDIVVIPPLPEDADQDRRASNQSILEMPGMFWRFQSNKPPGAAQMAPGQIPPRVVPPPNPGR